ncbi:MAG: PH domain-containing protein [Bacteroides sp.]|nr:PH domain-containing protein [Bacteroides sp.]
MQSTKPVIFTSEISWWLFGAAIALFAGMCVWILVIDAKVLLFASPALLLSAWVYYDIFTGTRYTIDGDILHIKCGVFINDRIKISNIRSIARSRSCLSSAALSTDRIMLRVVRRDKILISPRHRAEFIRILLKINPDIEVAPGLIDN